MAWTTPKTWNPGETVTASLMNLHVRDNLNVLKTNVNDDGTINALGIPQLVRSRVASDQTVNNSTTLVNIPGLSFPVGANEAWQWYCFITGSSGTTPDWKFNITSPASVASVRYYFNGDGGMISGAFVFAAFASTVQIVGTGTESIIQCIGSFLNGPNAGTVQVQFAQNTANASNTIVRANSYVRAERIS
jgi:hypothetical protein